MRRGEGNFVTEGGRAEASGWLFKISLWDRRS
jgi:hypothetical protein